MTIRLPRLARLRLLSEIHFAFGGALIMGGAGAVLAALALLLGPGRIAAETEFMTRYRTIATGAGVGWVGGLLWCALLAANARRRQPPPPPSSLMRATWVGAGASIATEAVALFAGLPEAWSVLVALVAATLAARSWVAAAARGAA